MQNSAGSREKEHQKKRQVYCLEKVIDRAFDVSDLGMFVVSLFIKIIIPLLIPFSPVGAELKEVLGQNSQSYAQDPPTGRERRKSLAL